MLILISPAKTFAKQAKCAHRLPATIPMFVTEARQLVASSLELNPQALKKELLLTAKTLPEAQRNLATFFDEGTPEEQALLNYSGMVFKKLGAGSLTEENWRYAVDHLRMTSFVYGLLRPTDLIRPYRMEGTARLPMLEGERVFDFWRDRLTKPFIEAIRAAGGTLLYLASDEMRGLFHWEEVERSVEVITPTFLTRQRDGSLRQTVIYTKMARGEMAREVLRQRITQPGELHRLTPAGFLYTGDGWDYILGD